MFINTFRYGPEDVDCRLCTAYARKTGCKKAHCPYLAERMEAGSVGYTEALLESFPANSPFRWRLRLLADRFDGTLWHNEKHPRRMETQKAVCGYSGGKDTPEYYAAMYLLTSDTDICRRSVQCFSRTGMDFSRIRPRLYDHCSGKEYLHRQRADHRRRPCKPGDRRNRSIYAYHPRAAHCALRAGRTENHSKKS